MTGRGEKPTTAEQEQHEREQALFQAVYDGNTASLRCPTCRSDRVEFSHTYVEPDNYAIWYACLACGARGHLKLRGRPPGFGEKLVLDEYQRKAEEAAQMTEVWWQAQSRLRKRER